MGITAHPTPLFIQIISLARWSLTEAGKYCRDSRSEGYRHSLGDCQTYCEANGAERLAINKGNYCRCCTASSDLMVADWSSNYQIYTLLGKYMYLASTNWCRKSFKLR